MPNEFNVGGNISGDGVFSVGDNSKVRGATKTGDKIAANTASASGRKKSDKFGILDAQSLIDQDLSILMKKDPKWGVAFIYLDIDYFKRFNDKYGESFVDSGLLPDFQTLIHSAVKGLGYSYAEGGDEIVIVLSNCSLRMAELFAQELLVLVRGEVFTVAGHAESLTVSMGVAHSDRPRDFAKLRAKANQGKADAKKQGRDRFVSIR